MSSSCCGACAGQNQEVEQKKKQEETSKQEKPTVQECKPEPKQDK